MPRNMYVCKKKDIHTYIHGYMRGGEETHGVHGWMDERGRRDGWCGWMDGWMRGGEDTHGVRGWKHERGEDTHGVRGRMDETGRRDGWCA